VHILGDDGRELAEGETGEICIRAAPSGPWGGCYRPMLGYWRRPAATRSSLFDGFLHTGDLGTMRDGLLFPKDRRDNLILRGGASVYPAQVERVIRSIPGVADCAVVGVADPRLGQRVAAALELKDDAKVTGEEILEYCRQRLARYEIPESVVFMETLPRNTMNKVVRQAVLAQIPPMAPGPTREDMRDVRIESTGAP
jgi:long-chain acyl-CoA synthetase